MGTTKAGFATLENNSSTAAPDINANTELLGNVKILTNSDSPYTITPDANGRVAERTIYCDTSGGPITVNLPTAVNKRFWFSISKITNDSSNVVVTANASEKIQPGNLSTVVLSEEGHTVVVGADETDFQVIGSSGIAVGSLTIAGFAAFGGEIRLALTSPAQITSNQAAYSMGVSPVQRLSSDATRTIFGIDKTNNTGRKLLINAGSNDIIFANQSASATADENKIITGAGADLTLSPDHAIETWRDIASDRFRIIGRNQ